MKSRIPTHGHLRATIHERRGLSLLWLSLGGLLAVLGSASCTKENAAATPAASSASLAVRILRVEPRPLELTVQMTGTLISSVAVDVKTEFPGRLLLLAKEEGDPVRQGDMLAEQDESNPRLALSQAEANLQTTVAMLERAKVAAEHAQVEERRAHNLGQSGGITERDLEAAEMAAKDTQAQVRLIQAQIEQARQAVAIAKKRLADCRVMAPISGQVERKFLNQGSYVDGGALLYRLVDNQRLELECYVSSAELGRLSPGQKVHFEVSAYPNQTFEARVSMISPAVQAMNRSVVVKAVVPNPGGKLRAGMFARGGIVTRVKQEAVVVPANAVWQRPNQPAFVFVVEQNHARKRIVKVGQEQPDSLEIVDGVRPGEVVVVEQYLELSEGSAISPLS